MTKKRSVFYYGHIVEVTSNTLRIDEGSGDVDITLDVGRYSMTNYVEMVSRRINAELDQDYTISVERGTRLITISAALNFDMKVEDIFPLNSGFPIMGFNGANLSGVNSYTGDSASGSAYFPQFPLQEYVDFDYNKEFADAAVNVTAEGQEEVVSFGIQQYADFNIKGITNRHMPIGAPIENNETGVADAIAFLDYAIEKGPMEFMLDRNDRDDFTKCVLNRTTKSRIGTGYTLKEDFRIGGFYETGKTTIKKVD